MDGGWHEHGRSFRGTHVVEGNSIEHFVSVVWRNVQTSESNRVAVVVLIKAKSCVKLTAHVGADTKTTKLGNRIYSSNSGSRYKIRNHSVECLNRKVKYNGLGWRFVVLDVWWIVSTAAIDIFSPLLPRTAHSSLMCTRSSTWKAGWNDASAYD